MRSTVQWVLLSSFLALALGQGEGGENAKEQSNDNPSQCCDILKALPLIDKTNKESCEGFVKDNTTSESEDCLIECMMKENNILNADTTIKEEALKKFLVEKAHPDVKAVLQTSFATCYRDYKVAPVKIASCDSGADELIECIINGLIMDCPDSMWQKTASSKCNIIRDLYKSAKSAAYDKN